MGKRTTIPRPRLYRPPIRHVFQRFSSDCGLAVISMLARVDYLDAIRATAPFYTPWGWGMSATKWVDLMEIITGQRWLCHRRPYPRSFLADAEWPSVPCAAIVRPDCERAGHFIAFADGKVFDPALNAACFCGPISSGRVARRFVSSPSSCRKRDRPKAPALDSFASPMATKKPRWLPKPARLLPSVKGYTIRSLPARSVAVQPLLLPRRFKILPPRWPSEPAKPASKPVGACETTH